MRRARQEGFTLIELMVALTVLLIGLLGIMGIVTVSLKNSSYSRHGTEAAILAEDKLEELRTQTNLAIGALPTEVTLDATGAVNSNPGQGIYTRSATVNLNTGSTFGDYLEIQVTVSWAEGTESDNTASTRSITLYTERIL
jgi:type IV pilus assembly protein PilV